MRLIFMYTFRIPETITTKILTTRSNETAKHGMKRIPWNTIQRPQNLKCCLSCGHQHYSKSYSKTVMSEND